MSWNWVTWSTIDLRDDVSRVPPQTAGIRFDVQHRGQEGRYKSGVDSCAARGQIEYLEGSLRIAISARGKLPYLRVGDVIRSAWEVLSLRCAVGAVKTNRGTVPNLGRWKKSSTGGMNDS